MSRGAPFATSLAKTSERAVVVAPFFRPNVAGAFDPLGKSEPNTKETL
jgi:hypothetical protein